MEISSSSRIFQTVSDFLHSYKSLASAFPRRFLLIEYDHNASNLNSRIKIISRSNECRRLGFSHCLSKSRDVRRLLGFVALLPAAECYRCFLKLLICQSKSVNWQNSHPSIHPTSHHPAF
ncbi:hypothetical protein T4B_3843 [Trichinella pseudospiralis]|uniref:Uncharacterized protein n=1 Tax=Trichinella pseudospiralis TaxID=6337 RepID=A0A0V1IV31_TRIPS|nr:hypothetical protein T4C_12114 [Trichinella pseudospiralis]KRZ26519.1 hypothetical protein T4C_2226 [Trichinella pseudospiralis]KRZ28886.1 hypothetical protein T4B_3843 [Trichinella pseudospiralis]